MTIKTITIRWMRRKTQRCWSKSSLFFYDARLFLTNTILYHASILTNIRQNAVPEWIRLQQHAIPHNHELSLRSRDRHVQSLRVRRETDGFRPHRRQNDRVLLTPLKRVHRRDLDVRVRQTARQRPRLRRVERNHAHRGSLLLLALPTLRQQATNDLHLARIYERIYVNSWEKSHLPARPPTRRCG